MHYIMYTLAITELIFKWLILLCDLHLICLFIYFFSLTLLLKAVTPAPKFCQGH